MNQKRKIKVLHIITRLDPGGSSTNTIETVARLDPKRFEVFLISGKTADQEGVEKSLSSKGIDHRFFPDLQREINPIKDIKALVQLHQFIFRHDFDIVHTHSSKAGILGRWAAKLAGIKLIIHTPHGHIFYGYFGRVKTAIFMLAERMTASITDKIITLTNRGKLEHIDNKIARADKFVTIYSGIDLNVKVSSQNEKDLLKQKFNIPSHRFVFGSVARLDPVKGTEFVIKAMTQVLATHVDTHLILVGEGSERFQLEQLVNTLGLEENITFAGQQDHPGVFIDCMDVFVLASLNEGMGRVILEAMVRSKPIIATYVGGIPELVEEGINGYLVKPSHAEALGLAMVKILKENDHRIEMGKQSKIKSSGRFDINKMIEDIEALYDAHCSL